MDTEKFDTCRYRSDTEIDFGEIGCCSSKQHVKLFICYERNIEGLTPTVCANCEFFEPRIIVEGE